MPFVRSVGSPRRVDALVVVVSGCQVVPSVEYSYPVTAEPPSEGAVKVTVPLPLPGLAISAVGAVGGVGADVGGGGGLGGYARGGGQRVPGRAVGGVLVPGDRRTAVGRRGEGHGGAGIARCRAQPGGSGRCRRGRGDTGGGRGCPGTDAVDRPDRHLVGGAVDQVGDRAGLGGPARGGGQRVPGRAVRGVLVPGDRRTAVGRRGEGHGGAGIARCRAQPGGSGRCRRGRGDTGGGRG